MFKKVKKNKIKIKIRKQKYLDNLYLKNEEGSPRKRSDEEEDGGPEVVFAGGRRSFADEVRPEKVD